MIPKTIHFTWFSNDPYPDTVKDCLASWHSLMPEYKFVHWDLEKIRTIDSPFLRQALHARKWAFAADFVRIWALYHEGGIYLDTDVLCYKPFDDLLHNACFIGKECSVHINGRMTEQYLTSHCMGAEAGHPFIKKCLDYYEGRKFITSENTTLPPTLRMSMTLLPYIQSEIAKQWNYCPFPSFTTVQLLDDGLVVYPCGYFDCHSQSQNTYCRHLALGSWREYKSKDKKITLAYKIQWRIEALFQKLADSCGYILTKKM